MAMTGSTWADIEKIRVSCQNIGGQYGIDPRVILTMIMQESHGYVGVRTTYSWEGIPTAGLLQCWNCVGYPGQVNLSQVSLFTLLHSVSDTYPIFSFIHNPGPLLTKSPYRSKSTTWFVVALITTRAALETGATR